MAGLASLARSDTWRTELAPTPRRWRTAARITIACAAAAGLGQAFHLEQGFWSIVTILVLAPPTVAASLRKAAARLLGTATGCLAAVGAVMLFAQEPPLLLAAIVAYLAVTLYFALGTVSPYAFFVSSFTFAIIAYSAVLDPASVGGAAASRFTEISLGVIVSAASHLLLWPVPMSLLLRRALSAKLRRAVAALDSLAAHARGESAELVNLDPRPEERLASQLDLLDEAAGLDDSIHRERDAWSAIVGLVEYARLSAYECSRLASRSSSPRGAAALRGSLLATAASLQLRGRAIAEALERRIAPPIAESSPPPIDAPLEPGLRPLDAALDELRMRGELASWSAAELAATAALAQALRSFDETLDRLPPFVDAAFGGAPDRERIALPRNALPSLLPLDAARVRGAIKGAIAAALAMLAGSALHWTLGIPIVATCLVLAVTSTLGSFVQKSGQRLIGTIVGAVIALASVLWVMPVIDSITGLVVLTGAVIFPCAWLLAGSDRVNYLGLQAAFAFSIGTLGPLRPTIDLWPPTSRMLGVLAGIAIFGLVTTLLWPVRATTQFRRSIADTLSIVIEILRDAAAPSRPTPLVPFARQRRLYDSIAVSARLIGESEYEDPGETRLVRSKALALLASTRRIARHAILWRQARWDADASIPPLESTAALESLGRACMERLHALAEAVSRGQDRPPDSALRGLVDALDAAADRDRASGALRALPAAALDSLFACVEHGRALAEDLAALAAQSRESVLAAQSPRGALVAYASTAS